MKSAQNKEITACFRIELLCIEVESLNYYTEGKKILQAKDLVLEN